MRKNNSNIGTWILSSVGAAAIALSVIVSLPTISKAMAADGTASCGGGVTVTCSGASCSARDNVGCACTDSSGQLSSVLSCAQAN